ncbi:MAG: imidazoleglycerol-phosphate dehydratase HisB [Myxococcota bacterium]
MTIKKGGRRGNGHVEPEDEPRLPVPVKKRVEGQPEPTQRSRRGVVERRTAETEVTLALDLDGMGRARIETPIPFFTHLLESLAKHSSIDLEIRARGDVEVDPHHLVEDVGLCLGRALVEAVGDRQGMERFGEATLPFDEALIRAYVDLSGRPAFVYRVEITPGRIGSFDVELAEVFFSAVASEGRMNLHLILEYGKNRHHIVEGSIKALARALRRAVALDPRRSQQIPSTKGVID